MNARMMRAVWLLCCVLGAGCWVARGQGIQPGAPAESDPVAMAVIAANSNAWNGAGSETDPVWGAVSNTVTTGAARGVLAVTNTQTGVTLGGAFTGFHSGDGGGLTSVWGPRGVVFDGRLSGDVSVPEAITNIHWDVIATDTLGGWDSGLGCYTFNTNHAGGQYRINLWGHGNDKQDFWLSTNGVSEEASDIIAAVFDNTSGLEETTSYLAGWVASTNLTLYAIVEFGGNAGPSPNTLKALSRFVDFPVTRMVIEEVSRLK
jgi:hypothetical protein